MRPNLSDSEIQQIYNMFNYYEPKNGKVKTR